MKILTFDLETENHKEYKRLAAPFNPKNYIVEAGWSINGGPRKSVRFEEPHRTHIMVDDLNSLEKGDIINGFNIKFDLLWIWHQESLRNALKRGVKIYCGQYAEYLLGGMTQDVQMCAMNDIAAKYGGGDKLDAVKELWEEGYLTSEIPADLLHEYLVGSDTIIGDVHNTYLIMQGQIKRMRDNFPKEFITMFNHRMDGLLATTEMEYNGMHVSLNIGNELQAEVAQELQDATKELESFIPKLPEGLEFNWNSSVHKSCLIFGGVVKYEKWVAHEPLTYVQKTEDWPLFDGEPVDPATCKLAGALYVREVAEEAHNTIKHKGKILQIQDTYGSGKKANQPKNKKVKVDDLTKPKGAKKPHYFKFEGFTKPLKKWEGTQTDAYDQPLYSTSAEVIDELAKRGLPFTNALAKRTKLNKDLGTYYWQEDDKGNRKGMLTLVNPEDGIIHHSLHHVKTVTSRLSSSDPRIRLGSINFVNSGKLLAA